MDLLAKFRAPSATATPATPAPTERTILEAVGVSSRNVDSFAGSGKEVRDSRDLARILELPRRQRPADFDAFRTEFEHLKVYGPCECESKYRRRCPTTLQDVQAWALSELATVGGLLGPISVGGGKTLLDLLACMVVPGVRSAVLLIPPQLRNQMLQVDWAFYGQHWQLPNLGSGQWFDPKLPTLHVIAYSELSSAKNSDILDRIKPDLIIADEAHLLKNSTTARTKRFKRYFSAHPNTKFCCWSGTLTTKSIKDYAHLSALALGTGSPLPTHWPTVEEWSGALDPSDWPTGIGALRSLCATGQHVREGFRSRLEQTSGVVSSPATQNCTASIVFSERKTVAPPIIHEMLGKLFTTWQRPDGEELVSALDVHRCGKELSAGFYYRWTWPRAEVIAVRKKWLEVRKDWHKEMREKLKQSKEFMDSPLLLTKAAIRWHDGYVHIERSQDGKETSRKEIPPRTRNGPQPTWASDTWPQWLATRDSARPETEGVWVDDWLARDAAAWCKSTVGICWFESDLFGRRVAECSGAPHFGAGSDAALRILSERGERSIVASIRSHGTGKNLQQFARNLFGQQFSDAASGEQTLGRTHRQGQLADEVEFSFYRHTSVYVEAFDRAVMLARYVQDTMGASQKLLIGNRVF